MVKMTYFFRNRRGIILMVAVICIAALSGILLARTMVKRETSIDQKKYNSQSNEYNAATLLKYKTPYVGNNSKVINLIDNLPFANSRKEVSLKTDSKPYGITVNYDFMASSLSIEAIQATLRNNAIVMFALIDNVDVINFNLGMLGEGQKFQGTTQVIRTHPNFQVTRTQLQPGYSKDLRQYARDVKTLDSLLNSFSLSLLAYPEKYALTMSSTPGIQISSQYNGIADKVQYSTMSGKLWSWDSVTGKVNEYGQNAQLPLDSWVYWSPSAIDSFKDTNQNFIKVSVFNKSVLVAEKQVSIRFDGKMYFIVDTSTGVVISEPPQNTIKHLSEIDFSSLNKIGIVSVVSDKTQKRYIEKEEKISTNENDLEAFRNLITKAKVNEYLQLDRLPGEYKINLYFNNGEKLTAYYWIESKENNFSIDSIIGVITLDSAAMNELITKIMRESIRKPNIDPYSKN